MAKSLSPDWDAQLRQIRRAQFQPAKQIRTWLERLELAPPATHRQRHTAPGEAGPAELPGNWQSLNLGL
ncbi:MAG: poly(3-hydroxybutyrate) depolymerase, partial [Pseudomonadota bacterium]